MLARARSIYRDAARLYRAHTRAVIGSAAVVLVPFALLDGAGLLNVQTSDAHPIAAVILVVRALPWRQLIVAPARPSAAARGSFAGNRRSWQSQS